MTLLASQYIADIFKPVWAYKNSISKAYWGEALLREAPDF